MSLALASRSLALPRLLASPSAVWPLRRVSTATVGGNLNQPVRAPFAVKVGDFVTLTRTFTQEDVDAFAAVTGDQNPIHLDPSFAESHALFGDQLGPRTICHGMLSASLFSAMFAARAPGAVYVKQTLKFDSPVFVGDTVEARIDVLRAKAGARLVKCGTTVVNRSTAEVAVSGEAMVQVL